MAALSALLLSNAGASAQVTGPRTDNGCVSVAHADSRVTAEGRLTLQLFPGPPNYESIATGDAQERALILELPAETCIDDGDDFAEPTERFVTVHVSARDGALLTVLQAAVGRSVVVTGEGFASHTGHHHAPLVILADRVTIR